MYKQKGGRNINMKFPLPYNEEAFFCGKKNNFCIKILIWLGIVQV